jgi:hypothetical protein
MPARKRSKPIEVPQEPERPTPKSRARHAGIVGVPLEVAGQTWLLAHGGLRLAMREGRDSLFDDWIYSSQVDVFDCRALAFRLLRINYDLAEAEGFDLVLSADPSALANAVVRAAIPLVAPRKTFTDWAEGALWANGVDPDKVPPHALPHVLAQLIATGRAISFDDYIDSAVGAAKRAAFLGMAQAQAKGEL